jgi:ABC-2 type transport system ATP-binding protein
MTPAIRTTGLRKSFGDQVVLDGVDLEVAPGTVYALLGPNGAGKTTTVHILSTLLRPDAGSARVAGHDVVREAKAVRAAIGVTGQFSAVDSLMSGEENLRLMADLRHLPRREGMPAWPHCSSGSTWSRRPASPSRPTPAACGADSTSR